MGEEEDQTLDGGTVDAITGIPKQGTKEMFRHELERYAILLADHGFPVPRLTAAHVGQALAKLSEGKGAGGQPPPPKRA